MEFQAREMSSADLVRRILMTCKCVSILEHRIEPLWSYVMHAHLLMLLGGF